MGNNYEYWGNAEQATRERAAENPHPYADVLHDTYARPQQLERAPDGTRPFDGRQFQAGLNNELNAWIEKNEPFAAHGHQFDNAFLGDYFSRNLRGYAPNHKVDMDELSDSEQAQYGQANCRYQQARQENIAMAQARPEQLKTQNSQILPESANQPLDPNRLAAAMNANQLALARQELFARHGYWFDTPQYQQYFLAQKWYNPAQQATPLSQVEVANLQALQAAEALARQR